MCGAVQYAVKSEPRLSFYANAGSVNESTSQVIRPNLLHRQKTQYEWVRRNLAILINKPSAFFSVNLTARKPDKNRPETNPYIRKFLKESAWQPCELAVFAGKIDYPSCRFLDRHIIRCIMWMTNRPTNSNLVIEFTDWERVNAFAPRICFM